VLRFNHKADHPSSGQAFGLLAFSLGSLEEVNAKAQGRQGAKLQGRGSGKEFFVILISCLSVIPFPPGVVHVGTYLFVQSFLCSDCFHRNRIDRLW
jgi:hypothetical protein